MKRTFITLSLLPSLSTLFACAHAAELPGPSVFSKDGRTSYAFRCWVSAQNEDKTTCDVIESQVYKAEPVKSVDTVVFSEGVVQQICDTIPSIQKRIDGIKAQPATGETKKQMEDYAAIKAASEQFCKEKSTTAYKKLLRAQKDLTSGTCYVEISTKVQTFEWITDANGRDSYWNASGNKEDACRMTRREKLIPRSSGRGIVWRYSVQDVLTSDPEQRVKPGTYEELQRTLAKDCKTMVDQTEHEYDGEWTRRVPMQCKNIVLAPAQHLGAVDVAP